MTDAVAPGEALPTVAQLAAVDPAPFFNQETHLSRLSGPEHATPGCSPASKQPPPPGTVAAGTPAAGQLPARAEENLGGSGSSQGGALPAEEAAEYGSTTDGLKREYARWTPEEEAAFYSALKGMAGQKPETCLKEITRRVGSKDYAQTRHYYYRLIKRLNKIMGPGCKLDAKNPLQVHLSMLKFYEVVVEKGMRGTCLVAILKKPRKQKELSSTVQLGVKAVLHRASSKAAAARGGGGSRKRKPWSADAAIAAAAAGTGGGQPGDAEMAEADAPPPTKQRRRTHGPSTRQQQMLAAAAEGAAGSDTANAAAAAAATASAAPVEGSSQSHTGAHEGDTAGHQQQPASSSQTRGSQPASSSRGTHSFRSSSNAGLSEAPMLEGSMSQASCKLRLQLMPLDSGTAQAMAAAGYHPYLELTLGTSKSLLSVLRHLGGKWQQAAAAAAGSGSSSSRAAGSALFVHPPADSPITLRGVCWGGPDCDSQLKMGDIFGMMQCPSPFQLLYSWGCPADATAAAVAAGRQASSWATHQEQQLQQQQQLSAEAQALTEKLREAISAVAVATAPPAAPAAAPAAAGLAGGEQQEQRLEGPESFMELLHAGCVDDDMAAAKPDASMDEGTTELPVAAGPAAAAAACGQPVAPARACVQQQQAAAVPESVQEQLVAGGSALMCDPCQQAEPPAAATDTGGSSMACAEGAGSGTPDQAAHLAGRIDEASAAVAAAAAAPATDPRKPRGLLGLLQTPSEKAPKRTPTAKKQPQPRKAPSSGRGSRGGRQKQPPLAQRQQQQQVGAVGQASGPQHAAPMPAAFGQFMWAQQLAVPILQQQLPVPHPALQMPVLQQAQHPMLQPAQLPAGVLQQVAQAGEQQQEQAAREQRPLPDLDVGNDSLFQYLDGPSGTAAGFPNVALFGSPGKGEQPSSGATLPGSANFSLRSWPSLSPPSNFQLPEGFESGLSPPRKAGGAAGPTAAGRLSGGAKAATAAAAPGRVETLLGPTDFSLLLASTGPGAGGSGATAAAAHQGPTGAAAEARQQGRPTAASHQQQADTLFGGASLFGMLGPSGAPQQLGKQQLQGGGGAAAAPLLPERELADLTFDFGSLLGVGDAAPSWLCAGGEPLPQQQHSEQLAALGDRPFASLFGSS